MKILEFKKGEKEIANFLLQYLQRKHGANMAVCLVDDKDMFCATTFSGRKLIEFGWNLCEIGCSKTKESKCNEK